MRRPNGWIIAGLAFALAALAVLAFEMIAAPPDGARPLITFGEIWFDLHLGSLNLAQAVIQRYIHPALWDPVIVTGLLLPAAPSLGVLGALLLAAGFRPKRRRFRRSR